MQPSFLFWGSILCVGSGLDRQGFQRLPRSATPDQHSKTAALSPIPLYRECLMLSGTGLRDSSR